VKRYIRDLIAGGEGLKLDFKYCISDSRKIARTLSAFANTEGGTLLIGVRDNGAIAGVRSEEEIYMIETAGRLFCKPEVPYSIRQHTIDGKSILEVKVEKGDKRPYRAKSDDGTWRSYSRQKDQNIIANRILLDIWRKEKNSKGVLIRFSDAENALMDYLRNNDNITLSRFRSLASINNNKARQIIVNMVLCGIIEMIITDKGSFYRLSENQKETG
jgi:predicted HTH transcriptional regulator